MENQKVQRIEDKVSELGEHLHNLVHHFLLKQHSSGNDGCPNNINKQEMRVIETLGKKGPCIMSELAENITLAVSTLTGIIDNMVEKQYVARERSEQDRRIVRVKLTDTGETIHQVHEENHRKLSFGILNALEEDEQETLLTYFRKISNKIANEEKVSI